MSDEPQDLSGLNSEERYDYFLSVVSEEREIWILISEDQCFLKIYAEEDQCEYLPVWPAQQDALAYAGDDSGLSPMAVALPRFFNKWVPGLKQDDIEVGVFPGEDGSIWLTSPDELQQDLKEIFSQQM